MAGAWLLFSFFAVLEWRDARRHLGDPDAVINFGIWGIQLLFVVLAAHFHRTETPREVLWFGDSTGYASGLIRLNDVRRVFKQLSLHIPELTDGEIETIEAVAREAWAEEDASITLLILFRGRSEKLLISF